MEAVQVKWRGALKGEKGLEEGDRLRDGVYQKPTALQINHLDMEDILVTVWVTVFLWPCRYDKYQVWKQLLVCVGGQCMGGLGEALAHTLCLFITAVHAYTL